MRVITLNVNGIRSAERKGFARWLARAEPWDVVCLQEIKAQRDDVPRALRAPRKAHGGVPSGASARATAASRLYASVPPGVATGFGTRSSTPKGATCRGAISRDTVGDQPLPALGVERARTARHRSSASSTHSCRTSPRCARRGARDHPVRRLEHRAPADRPQELAQQPEELRLPARGARMADARVRRARLRRRVPQRRPAARAVHVVVEPRRRRGRTTSAGASTTRSPRPASRRRAHAAAIYRNRRFSDHAPLIIDYDSLRLTA